MTTTTTGSTVRCELDDKPYPKGIAVSDEQMQSLDIQRADFHGEWNYAIAPSIRAMDSWRGLRPTRAVPARRVAESGSAVYEAR